VETLNFWIQNNLCSLPADTVTLPDLDPNDGSTVEKISFTNCSGNSSIIHFKVIDGGHSWPGGTAGGENQDINASVEILNFFNNYVNPLTNIAYGKKVEVSPKFFPPLGDTLIVNARLSNPESHQAQVHAMIRANRHAFRDTIQLFDDGQHHDINAFDNIWGAAKWFSGLAADNYIIDLSTEDITTGMTTLLRPAAAFTTIGPVELENHTPVADTLSPGDYTNFNILLRNLSVTDTAKNVSAWIFSKDSCVLWVKSQSAFDDIAPGAVVTSENGYGLIIDSNCNSSRQVKIDLFILSEGYFFWQDSFVIDIVVTNIEEQEQRIPNSFVLEQNYPNPFNPSTIIEFSIPKTEFVTLKIYNVLGQEVVTLVSEELKVGKYQFTWDAGFLASGAYLYRLQAGDPSTGSPKGQTGQGIVETKKMILLQ
jgi:type IX secretion system substrate protein